MTPRPTDRVEQAYRAVQPRCMYCRGETGHSELVYTGDFESLDGFEHWFCCHSCRDTNLPCETFFNLTS